MRARNPSFYILAFSVALSVKAAEGTTVNLIRTVLNPSPMADGWFGGGASISGNIIAAGAFGNNGGAGVVYVHDAVSGLLLQTIQNPTSTPNESFGGGVRLDGKRLVASAPNADGDRGVVYLFDAATGSLLHTFVNPNAGVGDHFGGGLDINGDKVAIGALDADVGAADSGVAYLFDAVTGNLLQTFDNPTPDAGDNFGHVQVSGTNVVVGAKFDDTSATDAGVAYLFDATTGGLVHTFLNPTPSSGDEFSNGMAIADNRVVLGSRYDDTAGTNSGAAYMFDAVTGDLVHTFVNPTPAAGDQFGQSIAMSGSSILIGEWQDDPGGAVNAGAAYLFDAVSGSLEQTILNPAPQNSDFFGSGPDIDGRNMVQGITYRDGHSGIVYFFQETFGPSDCTALKVKAAGKRANSRAVCYSKAVKGGRPVDPACLQKANDVFATLWTRAELLGDCLTTDDQAGIVAEVDTWIDELLRRLVP